MYQSPVAKRAPGEEEGHITRDMERGRESSGTSHQIPQPYQRSPTIGRSYANYSPNGSHAQPPYSGYNSRPSSSAAMQGPPSINQSPRLGHASSPSNGLVRMSPPAYHSRDTPSSTYYDPTSEHREREQHRDSAAYGSDRHQESSVRTSHQSPTSSRFPHSSPTFPNLHAHPVSHSESPTPLNHLSQTSPKPAQTTPSISHLVNGSTDAATTDLKSSLPPPPPPPPVNEELKPARADPMALSSLLSSSNTEPPVSTPRPAPPLKPLRQSSRTSNGDSVASLPETPANGSARKPRKSPSKELSTPREFSKEPLKPRRANQSSLAKKATAHTDAKVLVAMAEIDAQDYSDVDAPDWEDAREQHSQFNKRRADVLAEKEAQRRKRRRTKTANSFAEKLGKTVLAGKEIFRQQNQEVVLEEVYQQEIIDEKERKKDMQRKRRREKTVLNETQKQLEAMEKAEKTLDQNEKEKFLKEAQKAEKKVKTTKRILDIGDVAEEIGEVPPMAHNLEGGVMSSFQSVNGASPEPPRKKTKGVSTRPKKSKDQKKAEIENAEAAWAAKEREELVLIAPKEDGRKDSSGRTGKEPKGKSKGKDKEKVEESSPAPPPTTNYVSKGYNQIYEQIWKDIARKDIPKVYRVKENSLQTKQSNLRKTAQLASKEARRWQLKTNKSTKDTQARAKRSMREMMSFWKRNEREERDLRRVAEKQELDMAKKAEADREANRQKRKLNFLISQTELYSHFIGRKIKTDEVERSTDSADVAVSSEAAVQPGKPGAHTIDLPPSVANLDAKVTDFDQLDFDAEDESVLEQAAMANAQAAVQEAQNKARAFNNGGEDELQAQFDDGEMNFQNPTSLGDVDISQPKMLTCQLKEYQLKGLNWLVNLYEQGINGILADEMGLGKTVQSISVMAYLAEKHNIWGPFLVIAPASTLHNWQQEIARFVPALKAIPYWGTAKDRKVLRKLWDRKHITYSKDAQFHCLITSYQLVVQDTQYFQKMRWQYMILDEAQAIKSSSSSRWKSLLGFHCRNRLLLTGTPIQNNMQELWALLHFIMPSLFDSHDEFSDWFSKDIESHAQSNTKLNEDQLKRLHMILKPFMLRRIKKHVQKELGDKVEKDVYCDLTYRQRAYYGNLRNRISIMDLIEKAAIGDDQDTATLMNLVMQFRKVCNHPDLFERADTTSPLSLAHFAECASFVREGSNVNVGYSTRNWIEYDLPRMLCSSEGRLDIAGSHNFKAGFEGKYLRHMMNIWAPENIQNSCAENGSFSWLRFADTSVSEAYEASHSGLFARSVSLRKNLSRLGVLGAIYDEGEPDANFTHTHALFNIVERNNRRPLADVSTEGHMRGLLNVSKETWGDSGLSTLEQCARPGAAAPPIEISCSSQFTISEKENVLFNKPIRRALYGLNVKDEQSLLDAKIDAVNFPNYDMLPKPISSKARYTNIQVPSMQRFVTDSGKLAKLDQLLRQLKAEGHRVLLYFQMTRMIDLMEEYLTYRNYKYLRLDGSTKLEDRRDTVSDFQTKPEIFIFLLSTRAGGLGINLTSADTVIFYDSDWNPTIDSQAMDRAHRLGQTKQVTVYRMITRNTIEERIRKRALQKEEVQRVVISGGAGGGVDFNTRSKENKAKDIAMWLADDDEAELIEKKEKEVLEKGDLVKKKKSGPSGRKKEISMDDMYHEGEGHFDDGSAKPSGAATPMDSDASAIKPKRGPRGGKGLSKKAKTAKQRLAIADGSGDVI